MGCAAFMLICAVMFFDVAFAQGDPQRGDPKVVADCMIKQSCDLGDEAFQTILKCYTTPTQEQQAEVLESLQKVMRSPSKIPSFEEGRDPFCKKNDPERKSILKFIGDNFISLMSKHCNDQESVECKGLQDAMECVYSSSEKEIEAGNCKSE